MHAVRQSVIDNDFSKGTACIAIPLMHQYVGQTSVLVIIMPLNWEEARG